MNVPKLLATVIFVVGVYSEDPVVTIKSGKIRGLLAETPRNNVSFYAFMGIPYAKPPLGNLRFQPPQPVSKWDGVMETKKMNKMCYQADKTDPNETEDCLCLSVITPSITSSGNLPVMIHIHGGTFVHGHGMFSEFQPQLAIERGVIVVSINYRLGPFGFLSTGDSVVTGNMGLKDQQLAIKWVHENIQSFGGDPEKVTLTGQSAGGASVTYQLLYPENRGLFRAVISNSGSTLCTWAYQRHHLESAYGIANMINSNITKNTSTRELVEFLQSLDANTIDETGVKFHTWSPVMEIEHTGAFFTKSMYELALKGEIVRVPLLIGINSEECIKQARDLNAFKRGITKYDRNPSLLVNEDMYITSKDNLLTTATKIKYLYTNTTWENSLGPAVQFLSDDTFIRAIIKYAELQSAHTDVYFYQFSYHGDLGQNNFTVPGIEHGVAHAEDQRYLWVKYKKNISEPDLLIVDRYVTLMTNFAKTLNPTPTLSKLFENIIWPTVNNSSFQYLNIDTNITLKKNPRGMFYPEWVKIWEAYGRKPFISF